MYIVRWLMGHPIIAMWFLAAIAILLNFGTGSKNDIAKNGDSSELQTIVATDSVSDIQKSTEDNTGVIDDGKNKEQSSNSDAQKSSQALTSSSNTVGSLGEVYNSFPKGMAADDERAVDEATSTSKHEVASVESISSTQERDSKLQADTATNSTENLGSVGGVNTSSNTASNTTLSESIPKTDNNKSAAIADLDDMSTEEMLLMAREAYWNNGLDEAAQIYLQLIKLEPKVISHRGELGNVYWRQGYPKKAAELYSEISLPMIEQGESERVSNMIGFVGLFYPDRAAEIHKLLQSKAAKD
jgi:hypothetical protein